MTVEWLLEPTGCCNGIMKLNFILFCEIFSIFETMLLFKGKIFSIALDLDGSEKSKESDRSN